MPSLEDAEILVEGNALLKVSFHLVALGHLVGSIHAVSVEAVSISALIGQAG